jgi:UDP-N-acetylmuramate dehydrogenase
MQIQENISLKPFNSFNVEAHARYFARFKSVTELQQMVGGDARRPELPRKPALILGGGSNLLLTRDIDGLVLRNEIKGIEKVKEDNDYVYIKAGAGENWHQFVLHCLDNNWAGVENLSLIPGSVGASPMQNIGAYGVEIKELFHELKAWHLREKCNYTFSAKECEFGYRESVFKRKYRDQFVILEVCFRLRKQPVFNTSYGALRQELEQMGVQQLSIRAISEAVIRIRSSKLPNPAVLGNAGSFFKNPAVSREKFESLKQRFPQVIGYENADNSVKLAAGWLIEHSGPEEGTSWKGYRRGDAGCHEKQALVLVNYGNARGDELFRLSEDILQSVHQKFDVLLEREVNIL